MTENNGNRVLLANIVTAYKALTDAEMMVNRSGGTAVHDATRDALRARVNEAAKALGIRRGP